VLSEARRKELKSPFHINRNAADHGRTMPTKAKESVNKKRKSPAKGAIERLSARGSDQEE
jgi:hypothetical protein